MNGAFFAKKGKIECTEAILPERPPMSESFPSAPYEVPRERLDAKTPPSKESRETLQGDIRREKRLMSNIGYLTTLQQLADHSELDNLFDGQVVLGEEELLATYSLLDILNGNASFGSLRPPKKIAYERNFALDSSYEIGYETLNNPKSGKKEQFLSSIKGTTNLVPSALGDTNLRFKYDPKTGLVESAMFERPVLAFNENIRIKRNAA